MDIEGLKQRTIAHLKTYAGLDDQAAKDLTEAVCEAAQVELLEMVAGGEPYPTSMTELRLLRLRYMCEAARRLLTTQEVAVVFRTTETAAQTLITRMQAAYPDAVARYLDALVRNTGHAEEAGDAQHGFRYLIRFDELAAWEHAIHRLRQAGCTDLREKRSDRSINPPRKFKSDQQGEQEVLTLLGIQVSK
jgi:hypothetical protein